MAEIASFGVATATHPPAARPALAFSDVNVYAPSRLRSRALIIVACSVAVAAAAAGLGVLVNVEGGRTISEIARRHDRPARLIRPAAVTPTAPVSVLNAGSVADAARSLALQLRSDGVRIDDIGNLTGAPPPDTEVQYAPGQQGQAALVARLLTARAPTIAPMDPVTQAAAGAGASVVVVIP